MSGALWAVTSYFNPSGYQRRRTNYRLFRKRLRMPLLTVEWSADGRFELGPGDADLLVQIAGGDVMWQKERLLNVGVSRLPSCCSQVAWLDADIVFERDDIATAIRAALAMATVVQLYDRVVYQVPRPVEALDPLARGAGWPDDHASFEREGAAAALVRDRARPDTADAGAGPVATEQLDAFRRMPSAGFAWAASRALLERHPLFDAWVVGGGDNAFFHAIRGTPEQVVAQHGLSPAHRDWYLPRARALARAVDGRIGHVPGRILSLWHGSFEDRHYRSRHAILARHGFDPLRHLRRATTGAWAWLDAPAGIAGDVVDYFRRRNEDGGAR